MAESFATEELRELLHDVLIPESKTRWGKLDMWNRQRAGTTASPWRPDGVDLEYKDMIRKARTPWLDYAARIIAQAIHIDGYGDTPAWDAWVQGGMPGRQATLNRQVVSTGSGYLLTFPSDDDNVFFRPLDVMRTHAIKLDPWDEDPALVLHKVREPRPGKAGPTLHRIFDDTAMYVVHGPLEHPEHIETVPHDLGTNPVSIIDTGYYDDADPDLPVSPVQIGLPAYMRLVDATFTLLMIGRYGAFPQKWQSGGVMATDEDGNALVRPSVDSMLHSDDYEVKFGSFPAADIDKAVAAVDEQFEELAAILQVPPHYLLGKVVNLSSDALAATEAGYLRNVATIRRAMSGGYIAGMRKASRILGHDPDKSDTLHFMDVETRALGTVADATQKLISAGADPAIAFQLIPQWTKDEARQAAENAAERTRKDDPPQAAPPSTPDPQRAPVPVDQDPTLPFPRQGRS